MTKPERVVMRYVKEAKSLAELDQMFVQWAARIGWTKIPPEYSSAWKKAIALWEEIHSE